VVGIWYKGYQVGTCENFFIRKPFREKVGRAPCYLKANRIWEVLGLARNYASSALTP